MNGSGTLNQRLDERIRHPEKIYANESPVCMQYGCPFLLIDLFSYFETRFRHGP